MNSTLSPDGKRLLVADETQLGATVPGTFGPLGATLVHLVAAEESYLARLAQAERPVRAWA